MSEKKLTKSVAAKAQAGTAKTAKPTTAAPARPTARKFRAGAPIDLRARIERRAYELWERDGRPEGRDHAHWQQAEREIGAPRPMA